MDFSSQKGKKMHQCDFCDRLFSTASNMREHRRTHTGEKPFVCRYCGKAFAQSSTHSKHQLVHKSKEIINTSRGHLVRPLTREFQEPNSSDLGLTTLAGSSTSQPLTEPSLLPSKTSIKTLQNPEQSKMKTEVDFFDNLDWDNSNSVSSRQVDTSLQFNDIHAAAAAAPAAASSFSSANDNEQSSSADQKPVIIGMFKNRACSFSPPVDILNLQVKQETLEVSEINFESPSFLNELGLPGNEELVQHEKAENKTLEAPSLIFHDAKTINYDGDNKAFHSTLPRTVLSKAINNDNQVVWNKETPIIQHNLTTNRDTRPRTQDKFQSNTETFFKCIHCSETFSSLEEHICLVKEAKMFFKCQICQKTFSQYGPFVRHKQSHENHSPFTAGSSQVDISTDKAEIYENYESINIKKESVDISQITDSLYSRQQPKEASHILDVPASSLPSESNRIQSTIQRDEEQDSDDDVMIIETDTVQTQSKSKDVLENLTTIEKPRNKASIPTYINLNRFPNTEGGYFEQPNTSAGDVVKPHREAIISETLLKPNVVEKKTPNVSHLIKRQALLKKNLQPLGKKGHPFTCLFCPRKFSTASNMREHMRVHTGEKPFSCELCHKKFAQSSTRSKHMQTHRNHRMSSYLNGKKFTQNKNYKKFLRKPGRPCKNSNSFLPNRLSINKDNKEKPQENPMKSPLTKSNWNKTDTNLPFQKDHRPPVKENAFKMLPKPSNNFSFPPKTENNKIPSLNAKQYRQENVYNNNNNNNNNQFVYNKEGAKRMNVSCEKTTDYLLMQNNNQTLKNKMSFPSVAPLDSHISLFGSSFVKSKTSHLLPSTSHGFSQPSTSHGFSQPSTSHGFSQPSTSHGFSQPSTSHGFSQSNAPHRFSQPNAPHRFSQPNAPHRFSQPNASPGFSRPSASPGFSRPSASPGFSRPSASPGFSRPSASPGFSRPSASPGFSRPSASPGFSRPSARHRGAHRLLRNARSYRPFRCTYCPRTFSTLGNMKEHTRTHTGEKPFRCEYCHRCFAQSSTHSKHVQIHIRKQQLNCFFCRKIFSQVALLRNHIVTEHRGTPENSNRNNNDLTFNHRGSSNPVMVNKNRPSFSLGSNAQSESFLNPDEKNQHLQNDKLKKNKILELPDSNFEKKNVGNYELGSGLTEKRILEVDLSANVADFQIQEKNKPFLPPQESEANNCFQETIASKRVSTEILKDAHESTKSCVAKDSSISRNNLSNCISETTCVTPQLDSEMFEELLTKRSWLASSGRTRIQQEQIKNGSPLFELAQIKASNPELSSVSELDSGKSLAEDANMYNEIKPLGFSSEDLSARTSLNMEEELNKCTNSGEQRRDNIFLNDYCYQDPLSNQSGIEIQADNNKKNLTQLQLDSPQNINKDNLMHYDQTLSSFSVELQTKRNTNTNQPNNEYIQNKASIYDSLLIKEKNPPHQQIPFLKSDQQLSSPSSFTSPTLVDNKPTNPLPADAQMDTINKVGKAALLSLNNEQEATTYVSSRMPTCEQSIPGHDVSHVEQSNSNILDSKTVEKNLISLLKNSECSLNPCSSDAVQKLNWFLDMDKSETTTTTKREERTPEFAENGNSQILGSNIENSLQGKSIGILPNTIKLESNVLSANTEQNCMTNVQVKDVTNFNLTKTDSSLDSSLHFNISNITANAQYLIATETDKNKIIVNNPGLFSEQMDTIALNDEANFPRISSSESTSTCADTSTAMPPNNVQTSLMANRENNQQDLQSYTVARKFKCVYCSRCFSSRSNMKEHMRIHTGEKPFECVFCFRRFAQSSTHSKHVQTHLHFRQLMCPQCGKRFLQANNLYQHIKIQHRTSHASATKKTPLSLDPVPPTVRSHPKRKSLNNNDRYLYPSDSSENNQEAMNVPETSLQSETNNVPKYYSIPQNLNQINEETSNDLSKNPIELITSKDVITKSTIDIDLEKNNFMIDINDLPLTNSADVLSEINENPQFSSKHPITNSVQTLDAKNNLPELSDTSFKKSSDSNLYPKMLAPLKAVCQYEKTVCKKNDPHESNNHLLEVSGNSNICKTQSPNLQFKCEICSEEFLSDNLLNIHRQCHIINLANRRGFNLKESDIQELERCIDFRKSLQENKIKDVEESLEKVTADLGLKKSTETQCQAQQEKITQQIADKELSKDAESTIKQTEKSNFDLSYTVCTHSNLPLSDSSTFSSLPLSLSSSLLSSAVVGPVSATKPKKEQIKSSLLHFHKCLFCSKMFDALIILQEHVRTHVKGDAASQSKIFNKKLKECNTWYKHVQIVLGSRLKLPTRTSVENAQHLKVTFDIAERFKMLLHRNVYKCRQCHKECATFHSLLFHRHTHSKKLARQKIRTQKSRKLTKKAHGPSSFLRKRRTSSLLFCLEPISSDSEEHSFTVDKQEESHQMLVPLLCFSLHRQVWLVNLNGTLTALGSYAHYLPDDKTLTTVAEIESGKQHHLQDSADSLQQTLNKNFSISCLEEGEVADPTNKCNSNDKLEQSLNNSEDNNMKTDFNTEDAKNKGVLMRRNAPSPGLNKSGIIRLFGQEVTTVVSLEFQNFADCGKAFADIGHLKRKLQILSRNSLFPCKFCPKSFSRLSTFLRHVNMIHSWNEDYSIPNCRNDKPSSSHENNLHALEESVKSKYHQTKTQSIPGGNLADPDRVYLENLIKRVMMSDKRVKDFSDSPFARRIPSEESRISEIVEYPSEFSDKQLTESSVNHLSQPLQLQESNLKISTIVKIQSVNRDSAEEINFAEVDESNKTSQIVRVTDNFPTEGQQLDKEDKTNFSSSDDPKAVYKSDKSVEEKTTVGPNVTSFPSLSNNSTENQVDTEHDSQAQGNSNEKVPEKHLKENSFVECIFINDDPADTLLGESCLSSSQYLPNRNSKPNTSSEIIVLSDEENDDDSTRDKMQIFKGGNSSINIRDNTDDTFLNWLKENQIEDRPKAECKVSQDVGMSFKNCNPGLPEITGQKSRANLNDKFRTVPTTAPLQISSIATNSSRIVDVFSHQPRSGLSGKVHPCLYCSKTCSSTSNLKEHMRSHTGERPFSCSVCHKKFAQKSTLSKHTQIHTRFRKLSHVGVSRQESSPGANPDPAEPTSTNSLKPQLTLAEHSPLTNQLKVKHVSDITMDPKHTTPQSNTNHDSPQINCDSFYLIDKNDSDIKSIISFEGGQPVVTQSSEIVNNSSSSSLSSSSQNHHQLTSDIYPQLQNSADLFTYEPVFTKTDPARPSTSSYAVRETRVSNKPYSCDICNRTFTTSGNLKEHRRTHTGERPFECPFCEKTFVQASTRSRHVKNHSKRFAN